MIAQKYYEEILFNNLEINKIVSEFKEEFKESFKGLTFEPKYHKYTYQCEVFKSVTQVLKIISRTDFDQVAINYAIRHNLNVEDVKAMWKQKGEYASELGTACHLFIENLFTDWNTTDFVKENYINDIQNDYDNITNQMKDFFNIVKKDLMPIFLEVPIFDTDFKIAGTFDGLFFHIPSRTFQIWDWKTSKEINKNEFNNFKIVEHLYENNFNQYALQLSTYKYIIEKFTNCNISELVIGQFSSKNNKFQIHRMPYLKSEVETILNNFNK